MPSEPKEPNKTESSTPPAAPRTADQRSGEERGGSAAPDLTSKQRRRSGAKPELPWWAVATVLVLALALVAAYGFGGNAGSIIVVELMVAVAALSVGALLGFLFGIPRSPAQSREPDAIDEIGESDGVTLRETRGPTYRPSTNLEQVSDWLTKILVGVGLVEFSDLRRALASAGELVAASFKPPVPSASLVSQLTIIAFTVLGFLSSYLWTRVYYGTIQFGVDTDIWRTLNSLKNRVTESSEESQKAVSLASLVAGGKLTQAPAPIETEIERVAALGAPPEGHEPELEVFQKIKEFQRAPADFYSNPNEGLFGSEPSSANGRRLVGRIEMQLEAALVLAVRVEAAERGSPLEGEAIFLLHPTIPDPLRRVPCKDNAAEVKFYSEGWFHVVAIVDNLHTVLALDLRQVPDVPKWFKNV